LINTVYAKNKVFLPEGLALRRLFFIVLSAEKKSAGRETGCYKKAVQHLMFSEREKIIRNN